MSDRQLVLDSWLRRAPDPTQSTDPEVRQLLAQLDSLNAAVSPEPAFRAELRAQLVAVAPRYVTEESIAEPASGAEAPRAGRHAAPAARPTRAAGAGRTGSGRRWSPARIAAVAAALIVVLATVFGVSVWRSRSAIPGDALYGLKRASEGWQLDLASDKSAKALDYLHFAQSRAAEVKQLIAHPQAGGGTLPSAAGLNSATVALIDKALTAADSDTRAGLRLLGEQVLSSRSAKVLDPMNTWGPAQLNRLVALGKLTSSAAVKQRTGQSAAVMTSVWTRTQKWETTKNLSCLSTARVDDLGPLPCAK